MPRRARPASRRPPSHVPHTTITKLNGQKRPVGRPTTQHQAHPDSDNEDSTSGEEVSDTAEDETDLDEHELKDADAPRVLQWSDDEEPELEVQSQTSESEDDEVRVAGSSNLKSIRNDISTLPLGVLRSAQRTLSKANTAGDLVSDGHEDSNDEYDSEAEDATQLVEVGDGRIDGEKKEKKIIPKRSNKHAPVEMTSKRPVPRKRPNIEVDNPVPRDPRFLHIAGEFSADKFRSQYGFLSNLHEDELKTLKDNLKRATKLLATSPRNLREEREQEVQRLQRAVKRAESLVNRDRRERVEQTALSTLRKEEREKQKQGKKAWFMKEADKKELLVRAKYDALAESGGRTAVKKAIERKQKKVNQKEKKKRPFAAGFSGTRPARHGADDGSHKRRRLV